MIERILVVDDNLQMQEMLNTILMAAGYHPTSVSSGEEALELLLRERFSVMVLDLIMPGMNGLEVARRLKQSGNDIQVIILTGFGDLKTAREALRERLATDYIEKPFDSDELSSAIERALEKRRLELEKKRLLEELASKTEAYRRMNRALLESREHSSLFFHRSPVAMVVLRTRDESCVEVNNSFLQLCGFSRREVLSSPLTALGFWKPEDYRRIIEQDPVHDRECRDLEMNFRNRSGRRRLGWFSVNTITFEGEVAVVVSVRDITQARFREQEVFRIKKMASLSTLVRGICHEINNPNSIIFFNISLLRDYMEKLLKISDQYVEKYGDVGFFGRSYRAFRQDVKDLLDNMEYGSKRIRKIITSVRSVESDRLESESLCAVDVRGLIGATIRNYEEKVKARAGAVRFQAVGEFSNFFTNPDTFLTILRHLLDNALLASYRGPPSVNISLRRLRDQEDSLILEVADCGCGMDAYTKEHIFDPFFSNWENRQRTGLGLFVCLELSQDLNGRIEVTSEPGKGSVFRLVLPGKCRPTTEQANGLEPESNSTEMVIAEGG